MGKNGNQDRKGTQRDDEEGEQEKEDVQGVSSTFPPSIPSGSPLFLHPSSSLVMYLQNHQKSVFLLWLLYMTDHMM